MRPKKISLVLILFAIILVLSVTNAVHAVGVTATITVGTGPEGVAYDSAKGEIFIANYKLNTVSVISDSSNAVVATVPVGNYPIGVAYDSAKGEIFVANGGSNTVSVISDSSVTSSSPSTTIPEFTFTLPILLAIIVVTVSFCAIAVATKNRLETVLIQISGKRKH
jgi:YVTN family beta-propeller protein